MTDPTDEQPDDAVPAKPAADADDWAAALAEQTAQTGKIGPATQADGLQQAADDWAAALSQQNAATAAKPAAGTVFQPLTGQTPASGSDIDLIMDVPVQLTVELGRTRLTIKNLLQLGQGSVVELDGLAGEPMDIFVNGYLIAQGEVVVVEDKYGIRLTDIITPSERINRLNGRR